MLDQRTGGPLAIWFIIFYVTEVYSNGGQAGEKAPDGSPASRTKSESQTNASPRDISEEEAAQMAELVRDKALAVERQRQQWKRARMRDTGEAKTW